jgi:hypothetical protein
VKLEDVITEDGSWLEPEGVYWCLMPSGGGSVELYPVQNPLVEGSCVFFSGVSLRGSVYVPIVNGIASRVFKSKAKAGSVVQEAAN